MPDLSDTLQPTVRPPPEDGIGERIKEKRTDLKLSVEQLADLTKEYDLNENKGIPRSTLYAYESGSSKPSAREIRILAYALNVSPSYLVLSEEWDPAAERNSKIVGLLNGLLQAIEGSPLDKTSTWRNHEHMEKIRRIKDL